MILALPSMRERERIEQFSQSSSLAEVGEHFKGRGRMFSRRKIAMEKFPHSTRSLESSFYSQFAQRSLLDST